MKTMAERQVEVQEEAKGAKIVIPRNDLLELMDACSRDIEKPTVWVISPGGTSYQIVRRGKRSEEADSLAVYVVRQLCPPAAFSKSQYIGKLGPRVTDVRLSRAVKEHVCEHDLEYRFLRDLGHNAIPLLASSGRRYGLCAFCGSRLPDQKKMTTGYDEDCQKLWNLPEDDRLTFRSILTICPGSKAKLTVEESYEYLEKTVG